MRSIRNKLHTIIFTCVLAFVLSVGIYSYLVAYTMQGNHPTERMTAYVTRVIDGDTFDAELEDGSKLVVRLIGVDAPESVNGDASLNTEEGRAASEYAKGRLEGKSVELEYDRDQKDRYGRKLCYVYVDGEMFNIRLLRDGHAEIMIIPPNTKYEKEIREAENSY